MLCKGEIALKEKAQKLNKKSVIRAVVITVIALLFVYCSYSLINNYVDISRLKTQASEAQLKYDEQVKENERIKAILDSDNKDEYIEEKAREKGYVKEGETVFYDISDSK